MTLILFVACWWFYDYMGYDRLITLDLVCIAIRFIFLSNNLRFVKNNLVIKLLFCLMMLAHGILMFILSLIVIFVVLVLNSHSILLRQIDKIISVFIQLETYLAFLFTLSSDVIYKISLFNLNGFLTLYHNRTGRCLILFFEQYF